MVTGMAETGFRMSQMLSAWASPAGVLLLLGGIVWGVQLNVATMRLSQDYSQIAAVQAKQGAEINEVSRNLLRATLLLQGMEMRVNEAVQTVKEHNVESEDWKRRISILEANGK